MSIKDLLRNVHDFFIECLPYSQESLSSIQKWAGYKDKESFDTLLIFEKFPVEVHSGDLPFLVNTLQYSENTEYPLTITISPKDSEFHFSVSYDVSAVKEDDLDRILRQLEKNLSLILDCEQAIVAHSLVLDLDHDRVLEFGRAEFESQPFALGHEGFERCARATPNAIAVEFEDQSMTYGELNQRANGLARRLVEEGVQPGEYVALLTIPGIEMLIGVFGILKAGAAYVPLDYKLPKARIQGILEISQCKVAVCHTQMQNSIPSSIKNISLNQNWDGDFEFHTPNLDGHYPAYVIFTSGSTGIPKGVIISHKSLVSFVMQGLEMFELEPGQRVALQSSIGFDLSVAQIFCCLSFHGISVIRSDNDYFGALRKSDSIFVTPSTLALMKPEDFPNLKVAITAGEPIQQTVVDTWAPMIKLKNGSGPTEITIISSYGQLMPGENIHIGKPLKNTLHYIVDKELNLVPVGVWGEVLVGGDMVSLGYLNQPQLTKEKFIPNHFTDDGTMLHRTGDICRWTHDGRLEIQGRVDDMVKVKGYRIELNEVATVISQHESVTACVVLVKNDALVAYITPENVPIDSVRSLISSKLPHYMLPSSYALLTDFPLNQNGKVDRKQLLALNLETDFVAPETEFEIELARIWSKLLNVSELRIGKHSSFFEFGGDSISIIHLIAELKTKGYTVSALTIFQKAILSQIALEMSIAPMDTFHNPIVIR
jgi:amino acid adenylation domain-containing protein